MEQNRELFDEDLYEEGLYINFKLTIYALAMVVMMVAFGSLNISLSFIMWVEG